MQASSFRQGKSVIAAVLATLALTACAANPGAPVPAESPGRAPVEPTNKAAELFKEQSAQPKPTRVLTAEEKARNEAVAERSRQRTAAVMKRDYAAGYAFSTPGWRALYTVDHFRNQVSGLTAWKKADVIDVECESADKCQTRVRVETITFGSGLRGSAVVTHMSEVWLREGEQWFFVDYR